MSTEQDTGSALRRIEERIERIERDIAWVKEMAGPLIANPGKLLARIMTGGPR